MAALLPSWAFSLYRLVPRSTLRIDVTFLAALSAFVILLWTFLPLVVWAAATIAKLRR